MIHTSRSKVPIHEMKKKNLQINFRGAKFNISSFVLWPHHARNYEPNQRFSNRQWLSFFPLCYTLVSNAFFENKTKTQTTFLKTHNNNIWKLKPLHIFFCDQIIWKPTKLHAQCGRNTVCWLPPYYCACDRMEKNQKRKINQMKYELKCSTSFAWLICVWCSHTAQIKVHRKPLLVLKCGS